MQRRVRCIRNRCLSELLYNSGMYEVDLEREWRTDDPFGWMR